MIAVKTINGDSVYNIRLEYDVVETSVDVDSCRKRAAVSFNARGNGPILFKGR